MKPRPVLYQTIPHLRGTLMAAVDCETTGSTAGYHEIVEIAVVPLDAELRPYPGLREFHRRIRPIHRDRCEPEAMKVHGITWDELQDEPRAEVVADRLQDWFNDLNLPINGRLVPLAQNWAFESGFLTAWLGAKQKDDIFDARFRDTMVSAGFINDLRFFQGGKAPFDSSGLASLCNTLKVTNRKPHAALADALAEAEVYRAMLMIAP